LLGWEVRYKVAIGVCKALEYLHDEIPRPVIHMDVKASNILLSCDFQPQVPSYIHLNIAKNYWVLSFWVLCFPPKL
jgi:serine/threonine protein kinase